MDKNDWKEVARWTLLSGALVFASIGAALAWCGAAQTPTGPEQTVTFGGCEYKLNKSADAAKSVVTGTLTVTNRGTETRTLEVHIGSVDRTFKGSMLSRTVRPSDFSEVEVQGRDVKLSVASSATQTVSFNLKCHIPKGGLSAAWSMLAVSVDGKRVLLAALETTRPGTVTR